jgi:hypothetical protein
VIRLRVSPRWRKSGLVTYIKSEETTRNGELADGGELEEIAEVAVDECGEQSIGEFFSTNFAGLWARLLVVQG